MQDERPGGVPVASRSDASGNAGPLRSERPRDRWLVLGLCSLLLVPFLGRAVSLDDTLFLAVARQIAEDPFHPYDFYYNWTGEADWIWGEIKNPPLVYYWLALWLRVFGPSEVGLHAVFAPFSFAAGLAMLALARRSVRAPVYATALLLLCPAFWVSAVSLMIDVPMLAFYLGSIALFVRAVDEDRDGLRAAAGLAAAAAVLTKYFALTLLPVLALYALLAHRRVGRDLAVLLLPLAAFGFWTWASGGHVLEAFGYRSGERGDLDLVAIKLLTTLSFSGGLLVVPLLSPLVLAGRSRIWAGLASVAMLVLAWLFLRRVSPHDFGPGNEILFFALIAGATAFLVKVGEEVRSLQAPLDWLLWSWLVGGVVFCVFFNWTVNARTIVLFGPPAMLLWARWTEERAGARKLSLALTALVGVVVVAADGEFAEFGRREAARWSAAEPDRERLVFVGHWGFQHYMEEAGFTHLALSQPPPPGTQVVIPRTHRRGSRRLSDLPLSLEVVSRDDRPARLPVAVMNTRRGAGLHGAVHGPLPFVFTRGPLEEVAVLRW